jgi:hypothetical protein
MTRYTRHTEKEKGLPVTCPGESDALLPANWVAANRAAHLVIKSARLQIA